MVRTGGRPTHRPGAGARPAAGRAAALLTVCALLAGCGALGGGSNPDRRAAAQAQEDAGQAYAARSAYDEREGRYRGEGRSSIFDLFQNDEDPNTTLEVNRFIWNAALEVLDFMPIEAVDPFSGVIVMGYGTPPGGGTAYRATVYVQDPALDARSLSVALATRSGPASAAAQRAVEDAILTRARQIRIATGRL